MRGCVQASHKSSSRRVHSSRGRKQATRAASAVVVAPQAAAAPKAGIQHSRSLSAGATARIIPYAQATQRSPRAHSAKPAQQKKHFKSKPVDPAKQCGVDTADWPMLAKKRMRGPSRPAQVFDRQGKDKMKAAERQHLMDAAVELHSVAISARKIFDAAKAIDAAILMELDRMAILTAVAVKYTWIAFELWVRKALNSNLITATGCASEEGQKINLTSLLQRLLKWAQQAETKVKARRPPTSVPLEEEVIAELLKMEDVPRLELAVSSQTLNDVAVMMEGNLKTFARATTDVVEQFVRKECKQKKYKLASSPDPPTATPQVKAVIAHSKGLLASFKDDEDGLDVGVSAQGVFQAIYIRRQLSEITDTVQLVPHGHAGRYHVIYDTAGAAELLTRVGVPTSKQDADALETVFRLSASPACVTALADYQYPSTVKCDGVTVTVLAPLLVRHIGKDDRGRQKTVPQTYKSKHGRDLYKEPDPSMKVLTTVQQLIQQPEGLERGVCDLVKVLEDACRLLGEALLSATGADPPLEPGGRTKKRKMQPAHSASARDGGGGSGGDSGGEVEMLAGDVFDFHGVDEAHPNIIQLKRLQHIMDLDRCVTGDFGYGVPIQATNGTFLSLRQWYAQYSQPKRSVFEPGVRDGVSHKWAQNMVPQPLVDVETELSKCSLKVRDDDMWLKHARRHLVVAAYVTASYASKSRLQAAKATAMKKRSVCDQFVHEYLHHNNREQRLRSVYFGSNYMGGSNLKYTRLAGPPIIKQLVRLMAVHTVVWLVREDYSSSFCARCDERLVRQQHGRNEMCPRCWELMERDVNGALNIRATVLSLVRTGDRPANMPLACRAAAAAGGAGSESKASEEWDSDSDSEQEDDASMGSDDGSDPSGEGGNLALEQLWADWRSRLTTDELRDTVDNIIAELPVSREHFRQLLSTAPDSALLRSDIAARLRRGAIKFPRESFHWGDSRQLVHRVQTTTTSAQVSVLLSVGSDVVYLC